MTRSIEEQIAEAAAVVKARREQSDEAEKRHAEAVEKHRNLVGIKYGIVPGAGAIKNGVRYGDLIATRAWDDSKPWVCARKILKNGNFHKAWTMLFTSWEIEPPPAATVPGAHEREE